METLTGKDLLGFRFKSKWFLIFTSIAEFFVKLRVLRVVSTIYLERIVSEFVIHFNYFGLDVDELIVNVFLIVSAFERAISIGRGRTVMAGI